MHDNCGLEIANDVNSGEFEEVRVNVRVKLHDFRSNRSGDIRSAHTTDYRSHCLSCSAQNLSKRVIHTVFSATKLIHGANNCLWVALVICIVTHSISLMA